MNTNTYRYKEYWFTHTPKRSYISNLLYDGQTPAKPGDVKIKPEQKILHKLAKYSEPQVKKLYIAGSLTKSDKNAIAIVGSRKMSEYGRIACIQFAKHIASSGITIVSGLMYGIDLEAHKAALEADGRTIAILGIGIDYM